MKTIHTIDTYRSSIEKYNPCDFSVDASSKSEFLIQESPDKKLRTYYAPLDFINKDAKLIVVGITPGRTQMNNALKAACYSFHAGKSTEYVLQEAKKYAAFSGDMQSVLIQMMDKYGINQQVGITTCKELWEEKNNLVHFTSALRNPVFCCKGDKEGNYTGSSPKLDSHKGFKNTLNQLRSEILSIENAFVLPLGVKVAKVIQQLVDNNSLSLNRILNAEGRVAEFPHPSGPNGETQGLALSDKFPSKEEYINIMLSKYIKGKASENITVTSDQQKKYIGVRESYWQRIRHTRLALSNM